MDIKKYLKTLFIKACEEKSDINVHLPVLYKYAKKCSHITEFGARGGLSTRTFLYSFPDFFVSYDYQYATPEPHLVEDVKNLIQILEHAQRKGVNCEYIGKDVLQIDIEPTDMLFIDTWHCYNQTKRARTTRT